MKMGFALVERVLRDVHSIADEDAASFQERLRNLPRVGLVVAPSEGAGRRANFTVGGLLKLAFGVELLQSGWEPKPAALLAAHNWGAASDALLDAYDDRMNNRPSSRYLVIEPTLISRRGRLGVDRARFRTMDSEELSREIAGLSSLLHTRLLILNLAALLERILTALSRAGVNLDAVHDELRTAAAVERNRTRAPKSGFIALEEVDHGDD